MSSRSAQSKGSQTSNPTQVDPVDSAGSETATGNTNFSNRLRLICIGLAVIGTGVAGYLSYSKASGVETVCVQGLSNCSLVQNSVYAAIAGFPVAYLGLIGYLAILAALLLENRIPLLAQRGNLPVFGMTVIGFLFSVYFTFIEAFVLHAWCQWCVISAIVMTVLFGLSFVRV